MKTPAAKRPRNFSETRCSHRTPTGRRCLAPRASPGFPLCARHRAMQEKLRSDDLAADLTTRLKDIRASLQSVRGVHDSLAELYVLLAQDRVSPRRAAVMAYVSSLLLRTLPDAEEDSAAQKPEIKLIFGRGPTPEVKAAGPITDESQLTEDCPGAFYAFRTTYGPRVKKDAANSESAAIANYQAIST